MKYKPCCDSVCLLSYCETREAGGCYCVCRIKDSESSLISELKGETFRQREARVYVPGRGIPLEGDVEEKVLEELQKVREKLKEYEIQS